MRILFITSTRIGDAVLSTGLLHYWIQKHPNALITVACGAPAAGLFQTVPNLEKIIIIRKKPYGLHWLDLWAKTAPHIWDVVIDLRRSAISYFLICKKRLIVKKDNPELHKVQNLGRLVSDILPPAPHLWITPELQEKARSLVSHLGSRPVLCLGPTANWGGKTWPPERFAELAKRLTAEDGILPHAAIAIFGADNERNQAQRVIDLLPTDQIIDLVGKCDLLTCAAIFQEASLYIGNDSGLTHIAAAVGGNVLSLFGPSQSRHYAPWPSGNGIAGFVQTEKTYEELVFDPAFDYRSQQSLMTGLSVDTVEKAAVALWNKTRNKVAA